MSKFFVLGRGRLGTSLARALSAAGVDAELLPGRNPRLLIERLAAAPEARVVLAVPDPAVPQTAAVLAAGDQLPPGVAFIHLSGVLELSSLLALSRRGHQVGAFHPLQSFPVERPPSAFLHSVFATDATSTELQQELDHLALRLGGLPRRVVDADRPLYHAAAVMASSYVVTLAAQASSLLRALGWEADGSLAALLPLMRGAVENLAAAGLPSALIGPVRRGDSATVEKHLEAIEQALGAEPPYQAFAAYRLMGLASLQLALEAGLDAEAAGALQRALSAARGTPSGP